MVFGLLGQLQPRPLHLWVVGSQLTLWPVSREAVQKALQTVRKPAGHTAVQLGSQRKRSILESGATGGSFRCRKLGWSNAPTSPQPQPGKSCEVGSQWVSVTNPGNYRMEMRVNLCDKLANNEVSLPTGVGWVSRPRKERGSSVRETD